ncbi:MAG: SLATT domain-containing protein [Candidatus Brocadia sp.]|uniref:SMODS and SLOG-associating 2TM effector domain-containing protein n=1 Tax=Candidatus Brocadia fulgida TaxID=380242 RepID=A0A0M2USG0_9BACT|nr:MAG: hypothetical protein BROFUL_02552 [Candidatus Brocadia fulgida]MBV6517741.1 hypothetical protein [Candidatus Brocadia fulgida]MCC6324673.1 DUF4231 domain-containing protein [Candidatus Brocadia sp.]OQZ00583.1 MAG: hypothetical protein B6D35_06295 [Candidatus Brocadia sp. UTAMX2]UJS19415.1 MAG: SLATT domain-containing protein [Candidatus Brocadia sp.]
MSNNKDENSFPVLSWNSNEWDVSLKKLYEYVVRETRKAITWYDEKRRSKRVWGYSLRMSAIIVTGVSGVIPVLSQIFLTERLNPLWATIAIAVAAILIALDRFAGLTSGWVRYMITQMELDRLLETFCFDWEKNRLAYSGSVSTPEQAKEALLLCKEFILKIREMVKNETQMWASEFQTALKEIEKASGATNQSRNQ